MIEALPRRLLAKALSFVAVFGVLVITPAAEEDVATAEDFVGRWESSYGTLVLERDGERLSGTYMSGSTISGVVEDGRFVYRYEEANASGSGWFAVVDGGRGLAGKWHADGNERWLDWVATKILDPEAELRRTLETTYGRMRLSIDGSDVSGSYSFSSGSRVAGTVEGKRMSFVYVEPKTRGPGVVRALRGRQELRRPLAPRGLEQRARVARHARRPGAGQGLARDPRGALGTRHRRRGNTRSATCCAATSRWRRRVTSRCASARSTTSRTSDASPPRSPTSPSRWCC